MIRCQHCAQTFSDMKGLQIHNFLEHHRQEPEPRGPALLAAPAPAPARTPPAVINLSQLRHASPAPASPVSCHICGLKLPNQAVFQQVRSLDMKCSPSILYVTAFLVSTYKPTPCSGPTSAACATRASPPWPSWRATPRCTPDPAPGNLHHHLHRHHHLHQAHQHTTSSYKVFT